MRPPLLARAVSSGSAVLTMVPLKPVAVRIRSPTPLVLVLPLLMELATKSVTLVSDWPMMVLLTVAVTEAASPRT